MSECRCLQKKAAAKNAKLKKSTCMCSSKKKPSQCCGAKNRQRSETKSNTECNSEFKPEYELEFNAEKVQQIQQNITDIKKMFDDLMLKKKQ